MGGEFRLRVDPRKNELVNPFFVLSAAAIDPAPDFDAVPAGRDHKADELWMIGIPRRQIAGSAQGERSCIRAEDPAIRSDRWTARQIRRLCGVAQNDRIVAFIDIDDRDADPLLRDGIAFLGGAVERQQIPSYDARAVWRPSRCGSSRTTPCSSAKIDVRCISTCAHEYATDP